MLKRYYFLLIGLLFLMLLPVVAQDTEPACPLLVEVALDTSQTNCADTSRNELCYGNVDLTIEPGADNFQRPGDKLSVALVESIHPSSLDLGNGLWGIGLMQIQANLPATLPGQNVTMVVFGDVDLQAAGPPPTLSATVQAVSDVNVRSGPGTNYGALTVVAGGTTVTANGRSADGDWLRLTLDDDSTGWIFTNLLRVDGDIDTLLAVDPDAPVFQPMQAFYFETGIGMSGCEAVPPGGLIIQTPEGAGTVELAINDTEVKLGSTVFLEAQAGDVMTLYTLEGHVEVEAFGVAKIAPAGARVNVPIDVDLRASGPPNEPEPYTESIVEQTANVAGLLPRTVAAAEPLTQPELDDQVESLSGCTITADQAVNLRGGPGTVYNVVGTLPANENQSPVGQAIGTDGFTWRQLDSGAWVREDVVEASGDCESLAVVVDLPPVPPPSETDDDTENVDQAGDGGTYTVTLENQCGGGDNVTISGPTSMTVWVDGNSSLTVELAAGTYDIVARFGPCQVIEGAVYGVSVPGFDYFLACPPAVDC